MVFQGIVLGPSLWNLFFEDARRDGERWYAELRNKENKPLASAGEEKSKTKHMDSIL